MRVSGLWTIWLLILAMAVGLVEQRSAFAQSRGLDDDALSLLYATRLPIDENGEPRIRMGIADGVSRLQISATRDFQIRARRGQGGTLVVPAGTLVDVSHHDVEVGEYLYAVEVSAFTTGQNALVREEVALWRERGYEVRVVQVGAVFSLSGNRFDTRRTLVLVGQDSLRSVVEVTRRQLEERWGVEGEVYSELVTPPRATFTVEGFGGGLRFESEDLIWFEIEEGGRFEVRDVPYDVGTRHEGRESRRYEGALLITTGRDAELALVNEAPLETFIRGIVPAEIYVSAPEEALRAQAVAARSMLLSELGVRHLADPWMTCSDQRCQVYRGITYERSAVSAAIEETRGMVLAHEERVIRAYFSSNNGGSIASNHWTWGEPQLSYLASRLDLRGGPSEWSDGAWSEDEVEEFLSDGHALGAYSNIDSFSSGRNFRWSTTLSRSEANEAIARRYDIGSLEDVEVLERSPSGRVWRLQLRGSRGEVVIERELPVRRAFGGLKSALFDLDVVRDASGEIQELRFSGAGFGHGVGMCQSGAIGAAEAGLGFIEILEHYYPEAVLRGLYD